MGDLSPARPLFPATPEQLVERRAAMRGVLALAVEAHRSGTRSVAPDAIAKLASTFPVPVSIAIDWDLEDGQPSLVIRGPDKPSIVIPDTLTSREADVARLIVEGMTNAEVAKQLGISVSTVKDHVHHILQRTGHRNRNALAAALRRQATH